MQNNSQPNRSNVNDQKQGMGQTGSTGQKFVERFEMAVMQFVILNKAKQGGVTKENLQQTFRGNLQMQGDHIDHCIRQLVSDGHLKEEGSRYTITDDGREDVQKLQNLVIELPGIVGNVQGGQKPGVPATPTTGGSTGGNVQGNYGGQTSGNQGNFGTSSRSPVGGQGTQPQGSVNKGGATNPSGQQGGNR